MLTSKDQVLSMTTKLVQVNSIVNTFGEKKMAEFIYQQISSFPYFQAHPDNLILDHIADDDWERSNVIAYVKGTKEPSNKTIILMGHIDTVGIDDFNHLQHLACEPNELMQALKNEALPPTVQHHLDSGDWYFGRGVLDMKSGVASNLYLLKYYSEHPEELAGNLVFIAECDEEDSSQGIQAAVKRLIQWKETRGFEYIAAINSDFVSPRYEGDEQRYVYKGTVGKLLPAFFITGAETHVGSSFEGLDPNLLAAELTRQINYNTNLCDEALGEITVPPVSLKQTDLKSSYTVQTAISAYVYYNFFVHSWSPKDVLELLKEQATIAFDNALELVRSRYIDYCNKSGEPDQELPWKSRVLTYEDLNALLFEQHGDTYSQYMEQFKIELLQDKSLDLRMFSLRVVEEAWKWMKDKSPAMVLFYSSLHFPRTELTGKSGNEKNLIEALEFAVEKVQPHYKHRIVIRNFFPYISDMSFVSISDNENDLMAEARNNPAAGTKLNVNYKEILELDVPVINIGPYGMDAHKKYERMEKTYSLEIVPNLTNLVIQKLLG